MCQSNLCLNSPSNQPTHHLTLFPFHSESSTCSPDSVCKKPQRVSWSPFLIWQSPKYLKSLLYSPLSLFLLKCFSYSSFPKYVGKYGWHTSVPPWLVAEYRFQWADVPLKQVSISELQLSPDWAQLLPALFVHYTFTESHISSFVDCYWTELDLVMSSF